MAGVMVQLSVEKMVDSWGLLKVALSAERKAFAMVASTDDMMAVEKALTTAAAKVASSAGVLEFAMADRMAH